jgi:dTDP-4-dehydrorhamnose 3,5-epimerase
VKFTPTTINGMYVVDCEAHYDDRGSFSRVFCDMEVALAVEAVRVRQINNSFNSLAHTLRGMHWQVAPHEEIKIVRVVRGAIWDVVVDVDTKSPTYLKQYSCSLWAGEHRELMIPPNCAHGFMTLVDETDVLYFLSNTYDKVSERGFRWDDPDIGIRWPYKPKVISDRDSDLPRLGSLSYKPGGLTSK